MKIKILKCEKEQKLSKLISEDLFLSYNQIQKIIRNKDIKVDGKRVSKDIELTKDSLVEVYFKEREIKIIFENKDVVIVFKPRGIEVETLSQDEDMCKLVSKQINCNVFAVHRLDRNTEGLLIFAKNIQAKQCLDNSIKNRRLEKFYLTKVIGVPLKKNGELTAYLKKDNKKSFVYISDELQKGYAEIKTNYKLISSDGELSILEIELVTGKTHQIRAHLSHIGFPVLGDEKYGDSEINKKYNKKFQCLCAYKLVFHFSNEEYLYYLDDMVVELDRKDIKF